MDRQLCRRCLEVIVLQDSEQSRNGNQQKSDDYQKNDQSFYKGKTSSKRLSSFAAHILSQLNMNPFDREIQKDFVASAGFQPEVARASCASGVWTLLL